MQIDGVTKRKVLQCALAFSFVSGILQALLTPLFQAFGPNDARRMMFLVLQGIVTLVFYMAWFALDARERNYRVSRAQFNWLLYAMIVAAPYYMFRTRGQGAWKAVWRSFLFLIKLYVAQLLGMALGFLALHLCGYNVTSVMGSL